ncbi:MAG: M15 family metallopeptidase [Cyclobacteriaceae bacterium]
MGYRTLFDMKFSLILLLCLFVCCLWACQPSEQEHAAQPEKIPGSAELQPDSLGNKEPEIEEAMKTNFDTLARDLREQGLVRLKDIDSSFIVDLRYSTTHNFTGMDVYGPFEEALLQPEPAAMLAQANRYLKEKHPEYTLYIYDAVRPRSVQQILWDTLDLPDEQKPGYVANPQEGSIHNFGAAVDLTIAGADGQPLDMGTDFDYFGELAYPSKEEEMLQAGKLTEEQVANRRLLREVMTQAGFTTIRTEWWHFNAMTRDEAASRYGIVE